MLSTPFVLVSITGNWISCAVEDRGKRSNMLNANASFISSAGYCLFRYIFWLPLDWARGTVNHKKREHDLDA